LGYADIRIAQPVPTPAHGTIPRGVDVGPVRAQQRVELVVLGVLDHHHRVAGQQLRVDERPVGHAVALAELQVADLEAALAAVRAAGGEVLNEDAAPGERVGHVRDPAGNVIGICQQPGLDERERTVRPCPSIFRRSRRGSR
jgi:catechol 2,3-dioxygenase-like lactoylglutathione lyase family enzyme